MLILYIQIMMTFTVEDPWMCHGCLLSACVNMTCTASRAQADLALSPSSRASPDRFHEMISILFLGLQADPRNNRERWVIEMLMWVSSQQCLLARKAKFGFPPRETPPFVKGTLKAG